MSGRILPPTFSDLRPGDPRQVGRFTLLGRLGTGGMGSAFLAESGDLWVVVKVLHDHLAADPSFRARLRRELEALNKVSGSGAVRVIDQDLNGTTPWFAMEYVEGQTLTDRVTTAGPLTGNTLETFARGLADQIQAIHRAGITHRDIKPSNIVISPWGPRIIDFGIAAMDERTAMTSTGVLVGTLGWTAPEQVAGDNVGPAADIHAWGLCVLFAATGQAPFSDVPAASMVYKVVHTQPHVPENLPGSLSPLVAAALRKDPTTRPSLDDIITGRVHTTPPPTTPVVVHGHTTVSGPSKRRSLVLMIGATAAVLIALALGGFALAVAFTNQGPDAPATGTADPSPPAESEFGSLSSLSASPDVDSVQVGGDFTISIQTSPVVEGAQIQAFMDSGPDSVLVDSRETGNDGRVVFDLIAPASAGDYVFRFESGDSTGGAPVSTEVPVSVVRAPTRGVNVLWPTRPQRWCAVVDLDVQVDPATSGRELVLEYRQPGSDWIAAAAAVTDSQGRGTITVPACDEESEVALTDAKWRVVVAQTPSLGPLISERGALQFCPAPSPLPFELDAFAEFAPLEVVITNTADECAAYVRVEAVFDCLADAVSPVRPTLEIGRRVSDPPLYVGPQDSRRLYLDEIFTDSSATCSEYFPGYVLWPQSGTMKVYADYFAAP